MIKSNGNARYGVWDKGIYQKTGQLDETQIPEFPLYDIKGNVYSGLALIEYSNGDKYKGELKDGFRNGKVIIVCTVFRGHTKIRMG